MTIYVSGAVEGSSDEAVFRRLVGFRRAEVHRVQVTNGKPALRRALPGYNAAASRSPWLVLVDLDREFRCASELVTAWLPTPSPQMRFRVVVRQVESWLLADGDRFAHFFAVRPGRVPADPDGLDDAKAALLSLVATSRRAAIRADMIPRPGSGRREGPAYVSRLIEFASNHQVGWRVEAAATRSPSLAHCLMRLDELIAAAKPSGLEPCR